MSRAAVAVVARIWLGISLLFLGVPTTAAHASVTSPAQASTDFPNEVASVIIQAVQIAAGVHTCAVTAGGGVKCWGGNSNGQLGDGTTVDQYTPVDVASLGSGVTSIVIGFGHTCALTTNGGVKCWGTNTYGQLGDGTLTSRTTPAGVTGLGSGVTAVVAGYGHTCALTTNGGVKCWGTNTYGQLGDGTTGNRYTPMDVSGLSSGVTAIAAGWDHTCAMTSGGGVKCWGNNYAGQIGDGTFSDKHTPVDVTNLGSGVSAIQAGRYHACALVTSGGVKCWGYNADGASGHFGEEATIYNRPVDVTGLGSGVSAITAGGYHTCALTSVGGVKCWGDNTYGQLGVGAISNAPVDVTGLGDDATAIAGGYLHSCALMIGGGVTCWGNNDSGELGDGTGSGGRVTPVDVTGLGSAVTAIATGYSHTCALTTGGGVKCWGNNQSGQLGGGAGSQGYAPLDVIGLGSGVTSILAGFGHTCALTVGGGAKCWGDNQFGQLGNGTTAGSYSPVDVTGLGIGATAIAANRNHTCALTTGGAVKCWGSNAYGQLGDGTTVNRYLPVDVAGLGSGVIGIVAGDFHTCALTSSGGVKCWGYNAYGQLGDGTNVNRHMPVDVTGLGSGVVVIAAGAYSTCAVITSGGAKCWGNNQSGQIGDGTTNGRYTPSDVTGLGSGMTAITAGSAHTCALTSGRGIKCWGDNRFGQLGVYLGLPPVSVVGFGGPAHTVSGRVTAGSESLLADFKISVNEGGSPIYTATTNANGDYTVVGLAPGGNYGFTPIKIGYSFSPMSSLLVGLASDRTGVNFTAYPLCPTLGVSVNPPAGGSVATSIPRNCNAGSGFSAGTSVVLTATAASGYRFLGWSGAATSTSKVVNLVMNGNKSTTANFGPAQAAQKPPIIFVHGWHGLSVFAETSCSTGVQHFPDQTSLSDFGPIPSWLTQDFDVWIAHLTTNAFNTLSLDENGDCLRRQIDFVHTSTQNSQVTLIAHSMGGLVSRAAIEGDPSGYDKVMQLVTLGSPHLGVPMNNFLIAALCNAGDLGACEFSELGMAQIFNPGHSIRNEKAQYYVVGGHESNFRPRFDGGTGDGIISQRSATFLPGSAVTAYRTNESHTTDFGYPTYMEAAYGATDLVSAGVTFRCVISPTVYGRPRPQDCNAGELMQPAADEVPPLSQSPLISGSVAAGQVVSHAVWVESSGSSVFNLSWITGTLDFTLTSPVGQVITSGYAQANPTLAQFNSIPISSPFGAMASYGFTTTTPGLWTLWVGNAGLVSPVSYRLQVAFESPLAITTSLNSNVFPVGSTIVLTTEIGAGPAISNVQASVLFVWPDGATSAVTATAVDSNTLVAQFVVPPTSAGYAMAHVSVSGFVNGAPFEQGSHAEFLVPTSGAKLAGAYADHAVDESATGLFNALNWEAGISVTVPATYTVSADLMGAGQVIAHAQSQGFLASGTPTLSVKFSGDAIRASQLDGPYTVTNVVLIDSSSFGLLADSANAVWTTGAYNWKGFATTCFVLTLATNVGGTVSASPAPDCNSGLQYASGAVVTVTATANAGYLFSHWSDDASGASNSVTVTLSADRVPTANFTRWPHEAFLPILLR